MAEKQSKRKKFDISLTPKQLISFNEKVKKTQTCWLWTRAKTDKGYGNTSLGKHNYHPAHRISWTIHKGKIPNGLWVLHKCDVRSCVNPDHLYLGTHEDNMRDMSARNRHYDCAGEKHPKAILNWKKVHQLRKEYSLGKLGCIRLSRKYGITPSGIYLIIANINWHDDNYVRQKGLL